MGIVGSSYPLLDAFLTVLWIFLFVFWLFILFYVIIDIFRSHDINGWVKALWFIFILFLPLLGVLVYLIVRGGSMHERSMRQAQQQEREFRQYVQDAAGSGSAADQLHKLADLHDRGVLSDAEFEAQKAKVLSSSS